MFTNVIPELAEELALVSDEIARLADADGKNTATRDILSAVHATSGKGYRPSLLLLAGRMGPSYRDVVERLCRLGALVEYVHMASLVHDDIVDDSPTRRGAPTIQAKFGKDMAVFTGDLMLGQVMRVLLQENYRESGLLIAQTLRDMCVGEIAQADHLFDADTTTGQYYQNIFGKTVSLFITACKIGAMESGADSRSLEILGKLGEHLGYLFQIRDDLMDFLPEEKNDGKPVRQDFKEGVLTLPVLYALREARCEEKIRALILCAKEGRFLPEQTGELDRRIAEGGGFDAAVADAEFHRESICRLLEALDPSPARDLLADLVLSLSLPDLSR